MTKLTVVYDKKTGHNLVPFGTVCEKCGRILVNDRPAVVKVWYFPKTIQSLCIPCGKKNPRKLGVPDQRLPVRITTSLPINGMVINLERKPGMKAVKELEESTTIDHTHYAGRSEYNKIELPNRPTLQEIDMSKDKILKMKEIEELMKGSKPVGKNFNLLDHIFPTEKTGIEYTERKQIENKEAKEDGNDK